MGSMVGYFAIKHRKQENYLYFPVFPGISHFEDIGQGGISREIPPGKYRPGISRTTLVYCHWKQYRVDTSRWWSHLADIVGHKIGALSCSFQLSCLCLQVTVVIRTIITLTVGIIT